MAERDRVVREPEIALHLEAKLVNEPVSKIDRRILWTNLCDLCPEQGR